MEKTIELLDEVELKDGTRGVVCEFDRSVLGYDICIRSSIGTGETVRRWIRRDDIKTVPQDDAGHIVDNLTSEQEDKLKAAHAEDYHGTDDDMPDAFENWLGSLSAEEIKSIIA